MNNDEQLIAKLSSLSEVQPCLFYLDNIKEKDNKFVVNIEETLQVENMKIFKIKNPYGYNMAVTIEDLIKNYYEREGKRLNKNKYEELIVFMKNLISKNSNNFLDYDIKNSMFVMNCNEEEDVEDNLELCDPNYFNLKFDNLDEFAKKFVHISTNFMDNYNTDQILDFCDNLGSFYNIVSFYETFNGKNYFGLVKFYEEENRMVFVNPLCLEEIEKVLYFFGKGDWKSFTCIDKINKYYMKEKEKADKFDDLVVDNVKEIPQNYPLCAFSKIFIKNWDCDHDFDLKILCDEIERRIQIKKEEREFFIKNKRHQQKTASDPYRSESGVFSGYGGRRTTRRPFYKSELRELYNEEKKENIKN